MGAFEHQCSADHVVLDHIHGGVDVKRCGIN